MGWTVKSNLPTGYEFIKDSAVYIPSTNQIVLFGGNTLSSGNTNAIRIYDIDTDTWSTASGTLPFTSNSTRARYIPNLNLVAIMPTSSTTWYTCSDLTNFATWTSKAGNLSVNSVYPCTSDDDYMYLIYSASTNCVIVRWEPSTNVRTTLHTATPWLGNYGAAHHNGFIYLIGGQNFDTNERDLGYKYEIATDTFTPLGSILPADVQEASAAVMDGLIFVVGGNSTGGSSTEVDTVYVLDPTDDSVTETDSMPDHRDSGALVTTGTELYYLGGNSQTVSDNNNTWEFTYVPPSPQTVEMESVASAEEFGLLEIMHGSGRRVIKRPGFIPIF